LPRPCPSGSPGYPPYLTEIIDTWPDLPEPIRAGILAMIRTASAKTDGRWFVTPPISHFVEMTNPAH